MVKFVAGFLIANPFFDDFQNLIDECPTESKVDLLYALEIARVANAELFICAIDASDSGGSFCCAGENTEIGSLLELVFDKLAQINCDDSMWLSLGDDAFQERGQYWINKVSKQFGCHPPTLQ